MTNSNPYLILRRVRDSVIKQLRILFSPTNNSAVPSFAYNYFETAATGSITFYGNPSNGNTLTIGTNVITFVTGAPVGLQVQIGGTQQITLANLVAKINANSSTLLVTATTNSIPNQVNLKANTSGISGNSIILSVVSNVLRILAPTFTQGGLFDFDNSEIFISDAIPQNYQDWPCLIVDTVSASETRYLGPEDLSQAKNSFNVVNSDKIFSSLVVNVNISLYVIDDTIARDEIIDLIYNNLSEIRNQLAVDGIEMIDRTLPTETRVFQDQRQYITNRFVLRVYCEWTDSLTPIVNISGLDPVVTLVGPVPEITSSLFYNWSASGTPFNIINVIDGITLEVDSLHLVVGNIITQGIHTATILTVDNSDVNHPKITIANTAGWADGPAIDTSIIVPFSYLITATNNPTSYGATPLPIGLNVSSGNGLISGTTVEIGRAHV